MQRVLDIISRVKAGIATARKVIPPVIVALTVVLGTDAPFLVDLTTILAALGVYSFPNDYGAVARDKMRRSRV